MASERRLLGFVRLPMFERQAKHLLSEEDVQRLELKLMSNPEAGDRMQGTGGVRKLRLASGNRGKSGGLRVIYYLRNNQGLVYLITVYAKSDRDNLTKSERNEMRQLTAMLDAEA